MSQREILFKAKRIDNEDWVEGSCVRFDEDHIFILPNFDRASTLTYSQIFSFYSVPVYHETVCQYTGLTDKNGKKIFEGDILKWDEREWGSQFSEEVKWDYEQLDMREHDWPQFCEITGNIHDN